MATRNCNNQESHGIKKLGMNGMDYVVSLVVFCPHTNWQNATKAGRTNSRTNCQQNRIAISPLRRESSFPSETLGFNGVNSTILVVFTLIFRYQIIEKIRVAGEAKPPPI